MTQSTGRTLPLFYKAPQLLTASIHADLRLKQGDYAFARETNATPLAAVEFAPAMRHYPIVFSESDGFPVAVLGLAQENYFVTDGRWENGAYVPAYVRRYPFVFSETAGDSFALALDMGSDRVARGGSEGELLFEDDGKPTALVEGALAYCGEFHGAHLQTKAFVDALKTQDLLIDRRADAQLADGRRLGLNGFRIVDADKFDKLPDEVVLDWHRKGWLGLVHFHLASIDRFKTLLALQATRGGVTPSSQPDASDLATGAAVEPALAHAEPSPSPKSKKA